MTTKTQILDALFDGDEFGLLLIETIDKRIGAAWPQITAAFKKRDAAIRELRGELAALHSEVKALKSDMRKRAALSDEAHRCSLVRERAQEAEARLRRQ